MTKTDAQFVDPREYGARRLPVGRPVFDTQAIERAEHSLKAMGASMREWLDGDVERLQNARLEAEATGWSSCTLDRLMTPAHDLRGMGATYGFPLASQLAASLCRLIETDAGKAAVRDDPALARAHVDALRAVVRDNVRSDADPLGQALLREFEARIAALGVAPR